MQQLWSLCLIALHSIVTAKRPPISSLPISSLTRNDIKEISTVTGYDFHNNELLQLAFGHSSLNGRGASTFQSLELLGDGLIKGIIMGSLDIKNFPDKRAIHKFVQSKIENVHFVQRYKALGLSKFLNANPILISKGGNSYDKAFADGFEALVGAIKLDLDSVYPTLQEKGMVLNVLTPIVTKMVLSEIPDSPTKVVSMTTDSLGKATYGIVETEKDNDSNKTKMILSKAFESPNQLTTTIASKKQTKTKKTVKVTASSDKNKGNKESQVQSSSSNTFTPALNSKKIRATITVTGCIDGYDIFTITRKGSGKSETEALNKAVQHIWKELCFPTIIVDKKTWGNFVTECQSRKFTVITTSTCVQSSPGKTTSSSSSSSSSTDATVTTNTAKVKESKALNKTSDVAATASVASLIKPSEPKKKSVKKKSITITVNKGDKILGTQSAKVSNEADAEAVNGAIGALWNKIGLQRKNPKLKRNLENFITQCREKGYTVTIKSDFTADVLSSPVVKSSTSSSTSSNNVIAKEVGSTVADVVSKPATSTVTSTSATTVITTNMRSKAITDMASMTTEYIQKVHDFHQQIKQMNSSNENNESQSKSSIPVVPATTATTAVAVATPPNVIVSALQPQPFTTTATITVNQRVFNMGVIIQKARGKSDSEALNNAVRNIWKKLVHFPVIKVNKRTFNNFVTEYQRRGYTVTTASTPIAIATATSKVEESKAVVNINSAGTTNVIASIEPSEPKKVTVIVNKGNKILGTRSSKGSDESIAVNNAIGVLWKKLGIPRGKPKLKISLDNFVTQCQEKGYTITITSDFTVDKSTTSETAFTKEVRIDDDDDEVFHTAATATTTTATTSMKSTEDTLSMREITGELLVQPHHIHQQQNFQQALATSNENEESQLQSKSTIAVVPAVVSAVAVATPPNVIVSALQPQPFTTTATITVNQSVFNMGVIIQKARGKSDSEALNNAVRNIWKKLVHFPAIKVNKRTFNNLVTECQRRGYTVTTASTPIATATSKVEESKAVVNINSAGTTNVIVSIEPSEPKKKKVTVIVNKGNKILGTRSSKGSDESIAVNNAIGALWKKLGIPRGKPKLKISLDNFVTQCQEKGYTITITSDFTVDKSTTSETAFTKEVRIDDDDDDDDEVFHTAATATTTTATTSMKSTEDTLSMREITGELLVQPHHIHQQQNFQQTLATSHENEESQLQSKSTIPVVPAVVPAVVSAASQSLTIRTTVTVNGSDSIGVVSQTAVATGADRAKARNNAVLTLWKKLDLTKCKTEDKIWENFVNECLKKDYVIKSNFAFISTPIEVGVEVAGDEKNAKPKKITITITVSKGDKVLISESATGPNEGIACNKVIHKTGFWKGLGLALCKRNWDNFVTECEKKEYVIKVDST